MFCKNCGAELKDGAHFCVSCGHKVEVANMAVIVAGYIATLFVPIVGIPLSVYAFVKGAKMHGVGLLVETFFTWLMWMSIYYPG